MRFSKSFVLLVALLVLSSGMAYGQGGVSDSDFVTLSPTDTAFANDANFNFSLAVDVVIKSQTAAITLPLTFAGHPQLRIDTTVVNGGNAGISYGAVGSDVTWTIKSTDVDNAAQTMLIGFLSFTGSLQDVSGLLCNVHFDLDASGVNGTAVVDTTGLPPSNHLTFVDEAANEYTPQWSGTNIDIGATAVNDDGSGITPQSYALAQNYPNPFNAQTKIEFALAAPGHVELKVFNVLGQSVKTLVDKKMGADKFSIVWDGTNDQGTTVASGTYFYRIKVDDAYEQTHQMVLLK